MVSSTAEVACGPNLSKHYFFCSPAQQLAFCLFSMSLEFSEVIFIPLVDSTDLLILRNLTNNMDGLLVLAFE